MQLNHNQFIKKISDEATVFSEQNKKTLRQMIDNSVTKRITNQNKDKISIRAKSNFVSVKRILKPALLFYPDF